MGGWEIWFALIAAAAIWIVGHLLKQSAQNDEKRDQARPGPGERRPPGRPPGAGPRQAPARSELDRFLQEVNRRKQLAEQQQGRTQQSPQERRPARPRTVTVDRPPPRRVAEPVREVIPVEPAPTRRAEPAPVLELAEVEARPATVLPTATAAAVPVAPAAGAAGPVVLTPMTAFPPTRRRAPSPALRRLGGMLRSADDLRAAIMLREILDRPVCHRRR
jgi:hypothetical protein